MAIEQAVAEYCAALDDAIEYAMEVEVAVVARVAIHNAVETEVYAAYDPVMYRRRGVYGGLADQHPDNMEANYDRGTRTLTVQDVNEDDDTGRLVAPVVESGRGYEFRWHGQKPRPFHSVAQKEMMDTGWFSDALKIGLRAKGFKTE